MTFAIQLEDLRKTFGHTVRALDGVSFDIEPGTIFGLLGPNGAGKTTVVRILTTVLRADSGHARVLGHDVMTEPDEVRTLIGLAGQSAAVDENLTGAENLWMVGRLNHMSKDQLRVRSSSLLEQFGLTDAADRPTKTYSGGMRRRLDVAASLVAHPRVLFLDEPTTGLDPASRADVWAMIEGLASEGTTVLLTTQYLEEADKLAEHLVVIDHGKTVASGTLGAIKASIGQDVIEVALADPTGLEQVGQILRRVTSGRPRLDRSGRRARASATNGTSDLAAVIGCLSDAAIAVDEIGLRRPTLDEVFLALTGTDQKGVP